MPIATPKLFIDWDRSGSFVDLAYKDVSAYVKSLDWEDGQPDGEEEYTTAMLTAVLDNRDRYFSSRNTSTIFRSTIATFDTGGDTWVPITTAGADQRLSQSWTITASRAIDKLRLRLKLTGAPGGTAQISLYRDDGTGKPGTLFDSLHVSSAVSINGISTTGAMTEFVFPTLPVIKKTTTYHAVLILSGYVRTAGVHELAWSQSNAGYASGQGCTWNGTVWSVYAGPIDFKFEVQTNDVRKQLPIKLYWSYSGTDYHPAGFYGFIEEFTPDGDDAEQTVTITAYDPTKAWRDVDVNLAVQTNYRLAPDAVYNICNLVLGLTATQVSIGDDGTALPIWFTHNDKATSALERLRQAGAAQHWIGWVAEPDHFRYRWRNWAYDAITTTVDEVWTQVRAPELATPRTQLVNRAIVRAKPLVVQSTTDVWTYKPVPETWGPSETRSIPADLDYPCTAITTPSSPTDYTAGFTVTVAATYAQKVVLTVTAPVGGGSLALLKIRGTPATPASEIAVQRDDTDSQDAYSVISPRGVESNNLIQTWGMGNGLAGRILDQNSRELLRINVTRENDFPSQVQRAIGDRVTLPAIAALGLASKDWYIGGRAQHYENTTFTSVYTLREAPTTKEWFQWAVRSWTVGQWAPG